MHRLSFDFSHYTGQIIYLRKRGIKGFQKIEEIRTEKKDSTVCLLKKTSSYFTIIFTFDALSFSINIFLTRDWKRPEE